MLVSAWLIARTAHGQSLAVDELTYYGRVVHKSGQLVHYEPFQLEYLLAPYNGHLVLGGRLVYEAIFATVGADYGVLLAVHIVGLLLCVGLAFELMRRWVGPLAALPPCVLLLFLGFASETLLWPFNLHSTYALALSLAAVLALQRESRGGDVAACALLAASVATLEIGLAFAAGIGVWLLSGERRLHRIWIVAVPVVLYAGWWVWADHFDQSEASLANLTLVPKTIFDALASTMGALTGTDPVMPTSYTTAITWFGRGIGILAATALAVRLWRRPAPRLIWALLTALAVYWIFLAAAERGPEAGRYLFVSALLTVLVGTYALRSPPSGRLTAAIAIVAVIALPPNIEQLTLDRSEDTIHREAPISRTEFAMLELAEDHVDPRYRVNLDHKVAQIGGGLFIGLSARAYLDAAAHNGSLGYSLDQVRSQAPDIRRIADAALIGALGVTLRPSPPKQRDGCGFHSPPPGASGVEFDVSTGATSIRSHSRAAIPLGLRRFGDDSSSVVAGELRPHAWMVLRIPRDSATDPWHAVVEDPVEVCSGD
jgi:hypothetical protein